MSASTLSSARESRAGRPRRGGPDTALRILDAAEALFAERGYAGTTLRDVAARVGLSNPSIYNHFPGKGALYAAVLERGVGPVLALLSRFVEAPERRESDSAELVEEAMRLLATRPAIASLVLRETLDGGQRLAPLLATWIGPTFGQSARLVDGSRVGTRWTAADVPLIVLAMYHVVAGYFATAPLYRALEGQDLLAPEALARQTSFLTRLVDQLFRPEGDPAAPPAAS